MDMDKLYFDDYSDFADYLYTMAVEEETGVCFYCDPVDAIQMLKRLIVLDLEGHDCLDFDYIEYDGIYCPNYGGPYLLIISDYMVTCTQACDGVTLEAFGNSIDIYTISDYVPAVCEANECEPKDICVVAIGEYPEEDEEEKIGPNHGKLTLLFDDGYEKDKITLNSKNLVGFNFHSDDNGFTYDAELRFDGDKVPDSEKLCEYIGGFLNQYSEFMGYDEED